MYANKSSSILKQNINYNHESLRSLPSNKKDLFMHNEAEKVTAENNLFNFLYSFEDYHACIKNMFKLILRITEEKHSVMTTNALLV